MDTSTVNAGHLSDIQIRHMVMQAAVMAAHALTSTDQAAEQRLSQLIDAHGRLLAARGPSSPLAFSSLRTLLCGEVSALLPDGIPADEMAGVVLVDSSGEFNDDADDLEQELRAVVRAVRATTWDGRSTTAVKVGEEMDQDRFFLALTKSGRQQDYEHGRMSVITHASGSDTEIRRLNLPASITDFYRPISFAALYDRWWFACPLCRWPMKVTRGTGRSRGTGAVRCFHRPHAERGASYTFRLPEEGTPPVLASPRTVARPVGNAAVLFADVTGRVPEPQPAEGHRALCSGVWRWTVVPGLVEVALHQALAARGFAPRLWPDMDAYDIEVVAKGTTYRIDIKDYSFPTALAKKIQADGGDDNADWLVVPDYRANTVEFLAGVCREYGLGVMTAGDLGDLVCQKVGVRWA